MSAPLPENAYFLPNPAHMQEKSAGSSMVARALHTNSIEYVVAGFSRGFGPRSVPLNCCIWAHPNAG